MPQKRLTAREVTRFLEFEERIKSVVQVFMNAYLRDRNRREVDGFLVSYLTDRVFHVRLRKGDDDREVLSFPTPSLLAKDVAEEGRKIARDENVKSTRMGRLNNLAYMAGVMQTNLKEAELILKELKQSQRPELQDKYDLAKKAIDTIL